MKEKTNNNKRTRNNTPKVSHNAICFPSKFCARLFSISQGQLLVPKGIENNFYAKFCGENKLHYEECESRKSKLLTGLPVGRVEGGKVLSARFVFQVYFNWHENITHKVRES